MLIWMVIGRMNIAFVNNNYQLGGAEIVCQQLHFGCKKAGHKSTFYISEGKRYPRNVDVKPLYPGIFNRLYYSRFTGLVDKIFSRHEWTDKNFRKLAQSDADIIHIHNFQGQYAAVLKSRYDIKPIEMHIPAVDPVSPKKIADKILEVHNELS